MPQCSMASRNFPDSPVEFAAALESSPGRKGFTRRCVIHGKEEPGSKIMKLLFSVLGFAFLLLQYQLWLGDDSVRTLNSLELELQAQRSSNQQLELRNRLVEIEVLDLKNGLEAVEERARSELGMIEKGETFYLLVPAEK